jgi:hypothetical protein
MTTSDWEQWQGSWRSEQIGLTEVDALIAKTRRARAAVTVTRVLSGTVTVIALLVVAAALYHAANAIELSLGVIVAVGIIATWAVDASNHARALESVEAGPEEYAAVRRGLCARRIRFVYLSWIVVALDIVFLVPWWIGGFAIHGAGFHWDQILTMWGPLALMVWFVVWASRVRARSVAELRRLPGSGL